MRAIEAQGLYVSNAQLVTGNAEAAQAEILGDGEVFAITGAFPQGFDRGFPIIDLVPQVDVLFIAHLFVEELVDHIELVQLTELLLRRQQLLPGIDALLTLAQWPVQRLRPTADQGKIPVGVQAARNDTGQQQRAAQPAQGPRDRETCRQCEASRVGRWNRLMLKVSLLNNNGTVRSLRAD
ncbi:hypothetical protein D3C84_641330 [compost metagenome]